MIFCCMWQRIISKCVKLPSQVIMHCKKKYLDFGLKMLILEAKLTVFESNSIEIGHTKQLWFFVAWGWRIIWKCVKLPLWVTPLCPKINVDFVKGQNEVITWPKTIQMERCLQKFIKIKFEGNPHFWKKHCSPSFGIERKCS